MRQATPRRRALHETALTHMCAHTQRGPHGPEECAVQLPPSHLGDAWGSGRPEALRQVCMYVCSGSSAARPGSSPAPTPIFDPGSTCDRSHIEPISRPAPPQVDPKLTRSLSNKDTTKHDKHIPEEEERQAGRANAGKQAREEQHKHQAPCSTRHGRHDAPPAQGDNDSPRPREQTRTHARQTTAAGAPQHELEYRPPGEGADRGPALSGQNGRPTVGEASAGVVGPTALARRLRHTIPPGGNPDQFAAVEPCAWQQEGLRRDGN